MSVPTHETAGGVHLLEWEEEAVRIRVDRIYQDSRGAVTGEVTVYKIDIPLPHIHQARITLTGTRSRSDIARQCEKRVPVDIDWDAIIEQAVIAVLRREREGEPLIDLSQLEHRESVRYRVERFLFEGHPNLIYGDGGLGKSLFAMYLAVLVAAGCSTTRFTVEPGNVGYLDYEADADEQLDRLEQIADGLGIEKPPLYYRRCRQALASEVERLQLLVAEHNLNFLVIDSAAPAVGGSPEDTQLTISFFEALRSLNVTTLITAHVSKGKSKLPFGSVFWRNLPRSVWQVRKAQTAGENALDFSLWHEKVNSGRLERPLAYHINFSQSITFNDINVSDSAELAKGLPAKHKISLALKGVMLTSEEIADQTEAPLATVRSILSRGKNLDYVLMGDRWALKFKHND